MWSGSKKGGTRGGTTEDDAQVLLPLSAWECLSGNVPLSYLSPSPWSASLLAEQLLGPVTTSPSATLSSSRKVIGARGGGGDEGDERGIERKPRRERRVVPWDAGEEEQEPIPEDPNAEIFV